MSRPNIRLPATHLKVAEYFLFIAELRKYGFEPGNYRRIIVTWDTTPDAEAEARRQDVDLWDFRDLLRQIAAANRDHKTYFTDDTARTIQLFAMASEDRKSTKASPAGGGA